MANDLVESLWIPAASTTRLLQSFLELWQE
jgi:hypothetical protein